MLLLLILSVALGFEGWSATLDHSKTIERPEDQFWYQRVWTTKEDAIQKCEERHPDLGLCSPDQLAGWYDKYNPEHGDCRPSWVKRFYVENADSGAVVEGGDKDRAWYITEALYNMYKAGTASSECKTRIKNLARDGKPGVRDEWGPGNGKAAITCCVKDSTITHSKNHNQVKSDDIAEFDNYCAANFKYQNVACSANQMRLAFTYNNNWIKKDDGSYKKACFAFMTKSDSAEGGKYRGYWMKNNRICLEFLKQTEFYPQWRDWDLGTRQAALCCVPWTGEYKITIPVTNYGRLPQPEKYGRSDLENCEMAEETCKAAKFDGLCTKGQVAWEQENVEKSANMCKIAWAWTDNTKSKCAKPGFYKGCMTKFIESGKHDDDWYFEKTVRKWPLAHCCMNAQEEKPLIEKIRAYVGGDRDMSYDYAAAEEKCGTMAGYQMCTRGQMAQISEVGHLLNDGTTQMLPDLRRIGWVKKEEGQDAADIGYWLQIGFINTAFGRSIEGWRDFRMKGAEIRSLATYHCCLTELPEYDTTPKLPAFQAARNKNFPTYNSANSACKQESEFYEVCTADQIAEVAMNGAGEHSLGKGNVYWQAVEPVSDLCLNGWIRDHANYEQGYWLGVKTNNACGKEGWNVKVREDGKARAYCCAAHVVPQQVYVPVRTCGDNVCDADLGEIDQLCEDCSAEIKKMVCDAAREAGICDSTCEALSEHNPTVYAKGICGQVLANEDKYSTFCGDDCPGTRPIVCGDGYCDAGEVLDWCVEDCREEIAGKICSAAREARICDLTCQATSEVNPGLFSLGYCGKVLANEEVYYDYCKKESMVCDRPKPATTKAPAVCGDGNCDAGEIDQFCVEDCRDEIASNICAAAKEADICHLTCQAMSEVNPTLYAFGICGKILTNEDVYHDFCKKENFDCPKPVTTKTPAVCGDGNCDAGEIDQFCLEDCRDEIARDVCAAAKEADICDLTCQALAEVNPTLYAMGICGQLLTNEDVYHDFCSRESLDCPKPDMKGEELPTEVAEAFKALGAQPAELEKMRIHQGTYYKNNVNTCVSFSMSADGACSESYCSGDLRLTYGTMEEQYKAVMHDKVFDRCPPVGCAIMQDCPAPEGFEEMVTYCKESDEGRIYRNVGDDTCVDANSEDVCGALDAAWREWDGRKPGCGEPQEKSDEEQFSDQLYITNQMVENLEKKIDGMTAIKDVQNDFDSFIGNWRSDMTDKLNQAKQDNPSIADDIQKIIDGLGK